jgi:hypothetical protein
VSGAGVIWSEALLRCSAHRANDLASNGTETKAQMDTQALFSIWVNFQFFVILDNALKRTQASELCGSVGRPNLAIPASVAS